MRESRSSADDFESRLWAVLDLPAARRQAGLRDLAVQFPSHAQALQALQGGTSLTGTETDVPARIGPYHVLGRLGAGGMGLVVLAEQREPVLRRVAVKVIKRGMDSDRLLARFQLERQALAMMSHPCIATVLDAGVADNGQSYLAMEYVPGVPITTWCDERRWSLRERIELMIHVCAGVQHAHQQGVLHRDLKPSNILVAERDGLASPKIIDFGLAKLVDDGGGEQFTEVGNLVGTVEYMAPEQFEGHADTRSDVHALGVVLHELLVGERPFARQDLRQAQPASALRMLAAEVPRRPSTQVGSTADRAAISAARRLDSRGLQRSLAGDLDWIVLRALAREPDQRYGSPAELADDLQRHLQHAPVRAGPPRLHYRLRKFVRRHRGAVAAASLVLGALLVGAIGILLQAWEKAAALDAFRLLADAVRLEDARLAEERLYPATPAMLPAMGSWLHDQAEPLLRREPVLQQALATMRASATPLPPEQAAAALRQHPRHAEWRRLRAEADSRRRQLDVDAGRAAVPPFALPPATAAMLAGDLGDLGMELVETTEPRYGRESEALAIYRLALQKADGGDDTLSPAMARYWLAKACLRNGRFDECLTLLERAAELTAGGRNHDGIVQQLGFVRTEIARLRGDTHRREVDDLVARADALERVVMASTLRFADDGARFLDENLARVLEDLCRFAASTGPVTAVRQRLAWAARVRQATLDDHREAWQTASAQVADDRRFAGFRLEPQIGLVPIGRDPLSGLCEFVHLASGEGDRAIPVRDASGRLVVDEANGIVLVLVPGGPCMLGAQNEDPKAANHDAATVLGEEIYTGTLSPFLIGKYELTQAQYARIVHGEHASRWPAANRIGEPTSQVPGGARATHPIENVDQETAARWLQRAGLMLPSEAQWEFACRAGTMTPWYTGNEPAELAERENLFDREGARRFVSNRMFDDHQDGFAGPAPIGSYARGNPFGVFDMHGNVSEWVSNRYGTLDRRAPRTIEPGTDPNLRHTATRGGSYMTPARMARSPCRNMASVTLRDGAVGVRAAMAIQSAH